MIHLKNSKRFLDVHLPEITTAMRTCTPAAPLSEDHLQKGTGDGFLQAWPCGWHVLGEHCSQHGGKGT